MTTEAKPALLKINDLVDRWGVSRETVLNHIREQNLPFIDVGTGAGRRPDYRFRLAAVEAWEASRERTRRVELGEAVAPVPPVDLKTAGWDGRIRSIRAPKGKKTTQGKK